MPCSLAAGGGTLAPALGGHRRHPLSPAEGPGMGTWEGEAGSFLHPVGWQEPRGMSGGSGSRVTSQRLLEGVPRGMCRPSSCHDITLLSIFAQRCLLLVARMELDLGFLSV